MSVTGIDALLIPVTPDPREGEAVLGHVAARLSARLPRYLASVANLDVGIAATISAEQYGKWCNPSVRSYHIGLSGVMIIRVDESLAELLLEYRLGGLSSSQKKPDGKQGRAVTSLVQSIADVVSLAVADGWPGGGTAQLSANEDRAHLARNDDRVATISMVVSTCGAMIGQIGIAFPVAGLARVSGAPASPRDGDWHAKLREAVLAAELPVRAILARPELPAAIVMRLAVGDVLPISKPEIVPLFAGDHVVGNGTVIEIGGRTAIQFLKTEPFYD